MRKKDLTIKCHVVKIDHPVYQTPATFRDYDMYRLECASVRGWNEAMDFIFKGCTMRKKRPELNIAIKQEWTDAVDDRERIPKIGADDDE